MKHILIILLLAVCPVIASAQIESPVSWSYGAKKISAGEAVIFLKATINQGWHIYAQHMADGGPVRTTFTFTPSPDYSLLGATLEPVPVSRFESVFNMQVNYFEHTVIFQQKVKLNTGQTVVKGACNYMACTDEQCLPPADFSFSIPVK